MMQALRNGGRVLLIGTLAAIVAVVLIAVVGARLLDLPMPFSQEEVDRSSPVLLTELRDLAELKAAEAQFEVVVDSETDVRFVPDFIAGERVQYLAVGSIEATVDFSQLDEGSIVYDEDRGKAVVFLPAPTIGDPVLDFDSSGVMNRDRGVLDRIGGAFVDSPTGEEELIKAAQGKMAEAVPASDLLERAEANTEETLTTLLSGVGVEEVDVLFEEPSTS